MHNTSDTTCDVITVHTASSLKMYLLDTDTAAITNTIATNLPGLLNRKAL